MWRRVVSNDASTHFLFAECLEPPSRSEKGKSDINYHGNGLLVVLEQGAWDAQPLPASLPRFSPRAKALPMQIVPAGHSTSIGGGNSSEVLFPNTKRIHSTTTVTVTVAVAVAVTVRWNNCRCIGSS